jgi:hypothetical protein
MLRTVLDRRPALAGQQPAHRRVLFGVLAGALLVCGCGGGNSGSNNSSASVVQSSGTSPTACRGDHKKRAVVRGRVVPGVGAGGVRLGMTRRQVQTCLGPPTWKNDYGYEYGDDFNIAFDGPHGQSARDAGVYYLSVTASGFCLPGRMCVGDQISLKRLQRRYPNACRTKSGDGFPVVVVPRTVAAQQTITMLDIATLPNRTEIAQIEISWRADAQAVCPT